MGGEDDVVAHLATGNGGVVAHHRVVETYTELQMDMFTQDKAHGYAAVFTSASIAHHTVGQHNAVLYARRSLLVGENDHIVEGGRVLYYAAVAHMAV